MSISVRLNGPRLKDLIADVFTTPSYYVAAPKIKAEVIYTWNFKHFQAMDPDLAERVRTP